MYTILIERGAHLRVQNVHNTNREMCSFEGSKCTQY